MKDWPRKDLAGKPWPEKGGEAIDLAAMPSFRLGGLHVQPSLRRVAAGTREETVEPRVMQALIALAEAGGAVVSRDGLIERCWGGRIVGEDAINRCIAKVRRLAEMTVPPAFAIETVPRVGYLLKVRDAAAPEAAPQQDPDVLPLSGAEAKDRPDPAVKRSSRRRLAALAFGAVALAVAAGLAWRSGAIVATTPPAETAAPFNPPPHSVAVLAFANLSGDASQAYLSDGLSEALIDLLSRVNGLRVTARTSSFYFKTRTATLAEIARLLNVGAILEGSLRRQGAHLRIDVQLSDARTGFQLWTQSYDRAPDDLLKLQDDIARAAAEALRIKLIDTDAQGLNQGGTANPQAFDAYLRAEQHMRSIGDENDEALREIRRAVALDPDFALAQSRLAFTLIMIAQSSMLEQARPLMAEARRAADLAVKLAPRLGLTHAQRAVLLRNEVTDMTAAWEEAKTARALTPGNAIVEQNFALVARTAGHIEEAVRAAQYATDLDPLRNDLWWTLGRMLGCAGRYDEARDAFHHSIDLLGHAPGFTNWELGRLLLWQGHPAAARDLCLKDQGGNGLICRAIADHKLGQDASARADLAALQADAGDDAAYWYGDIYAQWGQPDVAVTWLKKARAMNTSDLWDMKCDPWLDPIRSRPEFQEIERSMHYPLPG